MTAPSPRPSPADDFARIERELGLFFRRGEHMRVTLVGDGAHSLDRTAYAALRRLCDDGPVRLTALAGELGLDASTVSRQVGALETAGLVQRSKDPDDGRACLLEPSAAGREALERTREARRAGLRRLLAGWPAEDRAQLARLLERLNGDICRLAAEHGHHGAHGQHGHGTHHHRHPHPDQTSVESHR